MAITQFRDGQMKGEVQGPASSTDNAIARYDGTGGKTIQDSSVTVNDTGSLSVAEDIYLTRDLYTNAIYETTADTGVTIDSVLLKDGAAELSGDLTVDTDTLYVDSSANKIGLGTDTPDTDELQTSSKLVIASDGGSNSDITHKAAGGWPTYFFGQSGGTLASPSASNTAQAMGEFSFSMYNSAGSWIEAADMYFQPLDTTNGSEDTKFAIRMLDAGSQITPLSIDTNAGEVALALPLSLTTDLAVAHGGTGASTASAALSNLGGIGAATTDTLTNKTIDTASNTIDVDDTDVTATVAFQVYRGTTQSVGTGWVLVQFDTESYDKGADYNTGTYKFVAPVAGIYHFDWRVSWSAMGNQDYASALYKGGTRTKRGDFMAGATDAGGNSNSSGSADLELAANDEIQIYSYLQTAGRSVQASAEVAYFSGHLVAAS